MDLCFASISTKQIVSLCALPHVVVLCLIINFVPAFTVSASTINAFFTGGKDQGKIKLLALAGLMAWIPGFHPGFPGSTPWQGIKILLHATV